MSGSVVVSQIGARMHYAVPRILHAHGRLERLYTDICAVRGWPRLLAAAPRPALPAAARRLAGRVPHGIPRERIAAFSGMGLGSVLQRMRAASPGEETAAMLALSRRFSRRVVASGFGEAEGFYGIASECLEQVEAAAARGLWTAVEQIIAPRAIVDGLVAAEAERFPEWREGPVADPHAAAFAEREAAEWAAADRVVCPSEFVRRTLALAGGPVAKCVVVPYGVGRRFFAPRRTRGAGPLHILTVGAVGLRKGSPYVLEAARRLRGAAEFRMVGPLPAADAPRRLLADALDLRGQVPRSEIGTHFAWADVFLLPSVCEGSATVIYEALAAGLPVVTTPNAGSVVGHGTEGFVLPVGDTDAIVAAILALDRDRERLSAMSAAARRLAARHDLDHYGRRLLAALDAIRPQTASAGARRLAAGVGA